jgi:ubiquinone/menaquinone biosynthesis C-methylase UbiE
VLHKKQVEQSHYEFKKYITKPRWSSVWHQLNEVFSVSPSQVLEIGPGSGIFKELAGHFGIKVETVDIDTELKPNYIASATKLPLADNTYDCVCCFQMLEHLPYDQSLKAFGEMIRVSRKNVVISLPDAKPVWSQSVSLPKIGKFVFHIPKPIFKQWTHTFDGEHYWEVNKEGYLLKNVIEDLKETFNGCELLRTYRVNEYTYHRFFIFRKIDQLP